MPVIAEGVIDGDAAAIRARDGDMTTLDDNGLDVTVTLPTLAPLL